MELRLLSLVSYLSSAAYLAGWMIRQVWALFLKAREWWFQRRMAGKVLSLESLGKANGRYEMFLSLAGALFGWVVTFWLSHIFINEFLLITLVVLAIVSEEFQITKKETQSLEVLVLLDRLQTHLETDEDLFECMTKAVQKLPAGDVQKAIREAVLRRRRGAAYGKSIDALRGIDPFLDEFVLSLQPTSWANGPALDLILSHLVQRAGRRWDHTSRMQVIKDQARPYVRFGRAVIISSLALLLLSRLSMLTAVWPGRASIAWMGLSLLALGLLLYISLANPWVRRSLVVLIFLAAVVFGTNTINVQNMPWMQVQTVTHSSDNLSEQKVVTIRTTTVDPARTAFFQPVLSARSLFIASATIPAMTLTPTLSPTLTITSDAFMPTIFDTEQIDPCCQHHHQPR